MKVKIRPTVYRDYSSIRKLLLEARLVKGYFTEELFRRLLRRNKGLYFVAEYNIEIIGTIFASHDGGYAGHLYKLAVDPRFRRNKVGTRLVKTVLKKLKKAHIDWSFGHIEKKNKKARKFFESLGLKVRSTHLLIDNG